MGVLSILLRGSWAMTVARIACVWLFVLLLTCLSEICAGEVDLEIVANAQKHRESYMRNYRAQFTVCLSTHYADRTIGGELSPPRTSQTDAEMVLWEGKVYFSRKTRTEDLSTGQEIDTSGTEMGFDGTMTRTNYIGATNGIVEEGDAVSGSVLFRIYTSALSPRMSRGPASPMLYLDEYVEKYYDPSTVSIEDEGNDVYLLQGALKNGRREKIWFDGRRHFVPIREELLNRDGGVLSQAVWTHDVDEQGRYFPKSREAKVFGASGELRARNLVEVKELVFDEEPDPSIFVVKFPVGKLVFDKRVNMNFRAGESGTLPLLPLGAEDLMRVELKDVLPNTFEEAASTRDGEDTHLVGQGAAEQPRVPPEAKSATVAVGAVRQGASNRFFVAFCLLSVSFFICVAALLFLRLRKRRNTMAHGNDT